jgi:hypothetical protein
MLRTFGKIFELELKLESQYKWNIFKNMCWARTVKLNNCHCGSCVVNHLNHASAANHNMINTKCDPTGSELSKRCDSENAAELP